MADIRIKDLATTAASTASDDFVAVDGSANGTRKLNAYSPTFGGNLTVSGTGGSASTISTIGTGTNAEQNSLLVDATTSGTPAAGYGPSIRFTRKGNDGGSSSTSGAIKSVAIAGTSGNQYNADIIIAPRLGGSLIDALTVKTDGGATIAGNLTVSGQTTNLGTGGASIQAYSSGTMRLYSASGQAIALFDGGSAGLTLDGSHNATLAGNLTVSGTGNSSVAGTFLVATTTNSSNGRIQLATHTTSAGGIGFGTDVSLFRAGTKLLNIAAATANYLAIQPDASTYNFQISTSGSDAGLRLTRQTVADWDITAGSSFIIKKDGTTALTLDSSQNATFAGKITANGAGSTFKGTSTNDDAAAGYVGEIITSTVESGSAVSLTSATLANITSISLTAGDWDVFGVVGYSLSGATVQSFLNALNNTSAAIGPTGSYTKDLVTLTTITDNALLPTPVYRFTLTSTSTVYLIGRANFTAGTVSGWGHIRARRVR